MNNNDDACLHVLHVFVGDLQKFMLTKIFPLHSINFEHFVNSLPVANGFSVWTKKKHLYYENLCRYKNNNAQLPAAISLSTDTSTL